MNPRAVPSLNLCPYSRLFNGSVNFGRRIASALGLMCGLLVIGACDAAQAADSAPAETAAGSVQSRIWMTARDKRFAVTLADTEAAREFVALLPLSIDMPDLNDNEKHVTLPRPLSTDTIRPGTLHNGDLMLYGSQTLVVFYKSFTSSYSYTPLGRVDDPVGLEKALGRDTARIKFARNQHQ